jgi:hypothetical protein
MADTSEQEDRADKALRVKCVDCGRFIAFSEMSEDGGARFYFEPDSHKGPEISEWTCARCTASEVRAMPDRLDDEREWGQ